LKKYTYCPAAGKIHRNAPTIRERLIKMLKPKEPFTMQIVDYYPAIFPSKR